MQKRLLVSIGTLVLGIIIYFLYYKNILVVNTEISMFVRYYIPDFLWMFSFYFFSINYSKKIIKKYVLFTAIYSFVLGFCFELLQLTSFFKGTFDFFDIITYAISIILACIVEKYFWRDEYEKIKN